MKDPIKQAASEIKKYFTDNYNDRKFTVKFNGEFFIVSSSWKLPEKLETEKLPHVFDYHTNSNTASMSLSKGWLSEAMSALDKTELRISDLSVYSQAKRLEKQLEFGLYSHSWKMEHYELAKNILYMLHTKSESIRRKIVKKCESEYNKLQIGGALPKDLIEGYIKALCIISQTAGESDVS